MVGESDPGFHGRFSRREFYKLKLSLHTAEVAEQLDFGPMTHSPPETSTLVAAHRVDRMLLRFGAPQCGIQRSDEQDVGERFAEEGHGATRQRSFPCDTVIVRRDEDDRTPVKGRQPSMRHHVEDASKEDA